MDLIYMNADKEDLGVMRDYTLDLAFGKDENDFECQVVINNHCCDTGFYLYFEGTEYGGIVDDIEVDTESGEITYHGRTWHGIMNSKVISPDTGEDYLVLSGEANRILGTLIERMGLSDLFVASSEESEVTVKNYKMNRYISGYDGIRKMLKTFGGKLNMSFEKGFVKLSTKPVVDYSKDEQFDTDQISFKIKKIGSPINHVICLGKGELADREVIHLYADSTGNITETQVFQGIEEVAMVYENVNAESNDDLIKGGTEKIQESWNSNELEYDFDSDLENYDVGDIVGARENVTGTEISDAITKKIVTVNNNSMKISYKVGE